MLWNYYDVKLNLPDSVCVCVCFPVYIVSAALQSLRHDHSSHLGKHMITMCVFRITMVPTSLQDEDPIFQNHRPRPVDCLLNSTFFISPNAFYMKPFLKKSLPKLKSFDSCVLYKRCFWYKENLYCFSRMCRYSIRFILRKPQVPQTKLQVSMEKRTRQQGKRKKKVRNMRSYQFRFLGFFLAENRDPLFSCIII